MRPGFVAFVGGVVLAAGVVACSSSSGGGGGGGSSSGGSGSSSSGSGSSSGGAACTGTPQSIKGTCVEMDSMGQPTACIEYTGSLFDAMTVMQACAGLGMFSTMSCPSGYVGNGCINSCGKSGENVSYFYGSTFTPSSVQMTCANAHGYYEQ